MSCSEIVIAAILSLKPDWTEHKIKTYAKPICTESRKRDIDPLIVVSVIQNESNWDLKSVMRNKNGTADYGLMQFNCDKPENIDMAWRKWWCDPKRRNYLQSVEGGIKAGIRELSFWKSTCLKKDHSHQFLSDCDDCFPSAFSTKVYTVSSDSPLLINALSEHWWVQHYNWNSKRYSRNILYVYLTLNRKLNDNYIVVRRRHYPKFNSKKCLKTDNLCLKEYKRWQQKQSLKKRSKTSKRKSKS